MGRDKATLELEGARLVDRALELLSRVCDEVVVANGSREITDLDNPQVHDRIVDGGPLAGIEAGLQVVESPQALVLAVDAPAPSLSILELVANAWDGRSLAVVPEVDGVLQPLHACWARSGLPAVTAALDAGERSPTRFLAAHPVQIIGRAGWGKLDPVAAFARSLNHPADLDG